MLGAHFFQEEDPMTAKTPRGRRTKTEVQQEFASIAEEAAEDKSSASSREALANQLKEAEIRNAMSGIAVEAIIHKMADLNTEISRSLSLLSEKLVGEVNLLSQVRSAIVIENEQLKKLHQKDIAATALEELIEEYQNKKSALEAEMLSSKEQWEKAKQEHEE